ncbi:MAG: 3-isopropylmalate dehydratase small subunit [Acidobacteria bacterium]|nr:3-isopropylmalate dehydratase small subunit [Acidobacteriota bacterium]
MAKFTTLEGKFVSMGIDNIDTDQIIPARFLKTISKAGLGDQLFYDWRYEADGSPKADFILNQEASKSKAVLLAGDNFGCGSSREHAPWALTQYGFRAVISTSFADIFKGNSLKNGLLPIVVPKEIQDWLFANPNSEVKIDLANQTLTIADGRTVTFPVDPFMKHCLLEGVDELGYILQQAPAIEAYEAKRVGSLNTLA